MNHPSFESPTSRSVARAQREVQNAITPILALATLSRRSLFDVERELWTAMLALSRAIITLFLTRAAANFCERRYCHQGTSYVRTSDHVSIVSTRFGKVSFTRPGGRAVSDVRGRLDLPVDRALGLCSNTSLGVMAAIAELCARLAFFSARDVFASAHEWKPGQELVLRIIDTVGAHARPFLERVAAPSAETEGEILVIQVDGGGAPMLGAAELLRRRKPWKAVSNRTIKRTIKRQLQEPVLRHRRNPGEKSKNAKIAVIGVIYTLRVTPAGVEGPLNKRIIATFESHAALFAWLHKDAVKRGYGRKTTLFLSDGAEAIWSQQQKYFPLAKGCLDWWHVLEKLWDAGACIYGQDRKKQFSWVMTQARRLRRNQVQAVLIELARAFRAIPRTGPGTKSKRATLDKVRLHLHKHKARMPYAEFRKQGWDIGSGVVEGAVRQLVRVRFDGPGMRWGRLRAELLLHLRCILLNGQWADFVRCLAQLPSITMAAKPVRAVSHQAIKKAA